MPRKQVITLTCQYSRYNQDFSCRLPECCSQRSPPRTQQQEYMVHGIPKRLHYRPRICVTPLKPSEAYFGCEKSPKMVTGIRNVLKMYGSDQDNPELETKLQCFHEKRETSAALDTGAGEPRPVRMSEAAKGGDCDAQIEICTEEVKDGDCDAQIEICTEEVKDGDCDAQIEICTEEVKDGDCDAQIEICPDAAGTNCGQDSILENISFEHLPKDTLGNQMSDTCSFQESLFELTATNITPPNSPSSEMEHTDGLTKLAMFKCCRGKDYSSNGINVIDESAVCDEIDTCDKTPASWYHKLVELELQNKSLQVPKPKNADKAHLPSLCKFQTLTPHFPSYEISESRRISRTERHVQFLVLKENSAKTKDKVREHVRRARKSAVSAT